MSYGITQTKMNTTFVKAILKFMLCYMCDYNVVPSILSSAIRLSESKIYLRLFKYRDTCTGNTLAKLISKVMPNYRATRIADTCI